MLVFVYIYQDRCPKMFWQRNIHEVMFNFVEVSWCCNHRCSNVCQPSLCCRCVTLVVRRLSLYIGQIERRFFVFSAGCQCYFGYVDSKLLLLILIWVLLTYHRLPPLLWFGWMEYSFE